VVNPVLTFNLLDEYRINISTNNLVVTHTGCGFAKLVDNNLAVVVREVREHHAVHQPDPCRSGSV
jgi:hypothetical protein